ncbi:MAG: hypothetical protein I8H68_11435 [Flavobacteriia bacterium]|nr:hypothetical protein [Flavobacteriia bacterium]MBH2024775.1 hypothetical protein [Flavobacteriales bacterium]
MKKLLILGMTVFGTVAFCAQEGDKVYEDSYRYYYRRITNEYPPSIPSNTSCWQLQGSSSKCFEEGKRAGTYAAQQYMADKVKNNGTEPAKKKTEAR